MVTGYIRVSTEQQDVRNQRHEVLEFANSHKMGLNRPPFTQPLTHA
jgi:DNA invertase Pin-like site-specific DNA recombinase